MGETLDTGYTTAMNPTIELIRKRVTMRVFQDKPVSPEHLDLILEGAMRAPTAGNMMMYSIIKVDDQRTKDIFAGTCDRQSFISRAPLVLVFLADMQRWFDYFAISDLAGYCRERGIAYRGPKHSDFMLATMDALIAAQTAAIVAESLGVASCYIGDIIEH